MTAADRPEVDDPRVLALAKARQQIAYESPFNFVCPPWEGLSEQEQHLSLLDARNYLRAALKAGLFASSAVSVVPPATNQTALLAEDLRYTISHTEPGHAHEVPGVWDTSGEPCGHCARLAVARQNLAAYDADPDAVLPAPVDRAAVLREAAARYEEILANADTGQDPRYWTAVRDITLGLRAMAAEAPALPSIHANDVQGFCPACGHPTLYVGDGGHLTCSLMDCPKPEAADELLHQAAEAPHTVTPDDCPHTDTRFDRSVCLPPCGAMHQRCVDCETAVDDCPNDAAGARQDGPTAYSDGKGRVFCLTCPRPDGVDVPVTVEDVDPWELCPSCGRHVVDVARPAAPAVVAQPGKETDTAEPPRVVQCSRAILSRPHEAHGWYPQPGMDPVDCPGYSFTEAPQ